MAYDDWPPLTVRDWQTVLDRRRPDWGSDEVDHDGIEAAEESRRLHELRGIIVGQVAEIESLLLHISNHIDKVVRKPLAMHKSRSRRGAGAVLKYLEDQLCQIDLIDGLREQIELIRGVITQRNKLVHATVCIGFEYVSFNDTRSSVIVALSDNDQIGVESDWSDLPPIEPRPDFSEYELERQLETAYQALEGCVDIWRLVNSLAED